MLMKCLGFIADPDQINEKIKNELLSNKNIWLINPKEFIKQNKNII